MNKIKMKTFILLLQPKLAIFLMLSCLSSPSFAELKELDDDTLDEHIAKAGITIDLSFKLSIGEIYFDFSDQKLDLDKQNKVLTSPTPRIEYIHGKN